MAKDYIPLGTVADHGAAMLEIRWDRNVKAAHWLRASATDS